MTDDSALRAWLSAEGGSVKIRSRDGVSEVVAAAHGVAACVPVSDLSDADQVLRCELEAIWQLKQLLEE
jgi:hypothetical protein